jgi:hypothetical protein
VTLVFILFYIGVQEKPLKTLAKGAYINDLQHLKGRGNHFWVIEYEVHYIGSICGQIYVTSFINVSYERTLKIPKVPPTLFFKCRGVGVSFASDKGQPRKA